MADYIERQAVLDAIEVRLERDAKNACLDLCVSDPNLSRCMARYNGIKSVRKLVEKRPAANVREDVKGRWINVVHAIVDTTGDCSVCKNEAVWRTKATPYKICPNCGARMTGGGER